MKVNPGIDDLISRKLSGLLTPEEENEFERWIQESSEHRREFDQLSAIWEERLPAPMIINASEIQDKIWKKGMEDGEYRTRNQTFKKCNGSNRPFGTGFTGRGLEIC